MHEYDPGFIHLPTGNVALVIVKGMTEHKASLDSCPSSCGSTSRWWLGDGWVMAVDGSLAPPIRLLSTSPAEMSVRGAAASGQQHRCTSPEDSNKNAGRSPLPSARSLVALSSPGPAGAGFTGSDGLGQVNCTNSYSSLPLFKLTTDSPHYYCERC